MTRSFSRRVAGVGDYIVLQDEMYPNPYFVYAPFVTRSSDKLGSATVEPALFGVTSLTDLIAMIMDFTKGQVMPRGVFQVKDGAEVLEGLDDNEVIAILNSMAKDIQSALDGADETQALVLAHEIVFTLVGALERANIDGAEMIFELLERDCPARHEVPARDVRR